MSLETFLEYGISTGAKTFLFDQIPLFLVLFAFVFLVLMILFFSIIKFDNVAIVAAPSFIIAIGLAWFAMRAIDPRVDIPALIASSIFPLLGVALVVIMIAQILKFLW